MIKQATKEAIILTIAAVCMAIAIYAIRPDKIGAIPSTEQSRDVQQTAGESALTEISIEAARHLFTENRGIFADARHQTDFEAGHIKGAVNLPAADQDTWLSDFLASTDPATAIVTYCDGENCHLALDLAEILLFNGFDQVRYLKNGWTRWRESGLPVE